MPTLSASRAGWAGGCPQVGSGEPGGWRKSAWSSSWVRKTASLERTSCLRPDDPEPNPVLPLPPSSPSPSPGTPPCAELGSLYLGQTHGPLHPWNLGGGLHGEGLCRHLTSAPASWEQDQGPGGKALSSTLVAAGRSQPGSLLLSSFPAFSLA